MIITPNNIADIIMLFRVIAKDVTKSSLPFCLLLLGVS